jgi:hypothetical protein
MRRSFLWLALLVLAVIGAAAVAASAIGGGLAETWAAATSPDLLQEPRGVAGVVAIAGIVAGGLGVALAIVASLVVPRRRHDEELLQERIERALARSRMATLERHVVVTGVSHVARAVATELGRRGIAAVVLERDRERAARMRVFLTHVVEGDPRNAEALRAAGADRALALALCGLGERERRRAAAAAGALRPDLRVAAVHDAEGAYAFADALAKAPGAPPASAIG